MDLAAPHIGFVVAAYALAIALLSGLTLSVWLRYRRTVRRLSDMQAGGAPRRRRADSRS